MLTDEQWLELYTSSVENRKDISFIKDTLGNNQLDIKECQRKVNTLEIEDSFKKGKVAFLVVSVTTLFTVLVNGLLWSFNYFGGSK